MAELGLDLGLFISQVANFVVLLLLLWALLYKPVLKKLTERAERIKKGVDDADEAGKLLEQAHARHEQELVEGRREAREIIEQATRAGEQQRQEILAQAKTDAQEIVARAQRQAMREIEEGRVALRQQIVDMAMAGATRLIQDSLDDAKHRVLIEDLLDQAERELVPDSQRPSPPHQDNR